MIMKEKTIKITIKHFNTAQDRPDYKNLGLKEFNSLAFQFSRPAEGEYIIDTTHMFDNQYNAFRKRGEKGVRVFEFCEKLSNDKVKPTGEGYYIASGIDDIRALQKRIIACGYCGKQYKDSKQEWCTACRGSEYLTPDCYHLLKLSPLDCRDRSKHVIPVDIIADILEQQRITRTLKLEKQKAEKLADLRQGIKDAEIEYRAFEWLIGKGLDFENCIYYSHTKTFCFGWRKMLSPDEKEKLTTILKDFPYQWEFKNGK